MKSSIKNWCLLGLSLIFTLGIISIINITDAITINASSNSGHIVRLHSLFLWGTDVNDTVSISIDDASLKLSGGPIIGENNSSTKKSSIVGGGKDNSINSENSAIGGGSSNKVQGKNSFIGGGQSNEISSESSVIGGGSGNNITANKSVIVGGKENKIEGVNSVIIGGNKNTAKGKNSIVLGYNSTGNEGSFAWRAESIANSARIDADNGVLIGTNTPITGVKLLISGAASLPNSLISENIKNILGTGGEIIVKNGCIYANNGVNWQVVGKMSKNTSECGLTGGVCKFGEVFLSEGDRVIGYDIGFDENCNNHKKNVTCEGNGTLSDPGYIYPYCYTITSQKKSS